MAGCREPTQQEATKLLNDVCKMVVELRNKKKTPTYILVNENFIITLRSHAPCCRPNNGFWFDSVVDGRITETLCDMIVVIERSCHDFDEKPEFKILVEA